MSPSMRQQNYTSNKICTKFPGLLTYGQNGDVQIKYMLWKYNILYIYICNTIFAHLCSDLFCQKSNLSSVYYDMLAHLYTIVLFSSDEIIEQMIKLFFGSSIPKFSGKKQKWQCVSSYV